MTKSATTSQGEKKRSVRDELKAKREEILKQASKEYLRQLERLKQEGRKFIEEFVIPKLEVAVIKYPDSDSYSVTIVEDELSMTGYIYYINSSDNEDELPASLAKKSLNFAAEMAEEYGITAHIEHSGKGTTSFIFSVELD